MPSSSDPRVHPFLTQRCLAYIVADKDNHAHAVANEAGAMQQLVKLVSLSYGLQTAGQDSAPLAYISDIAASAAYSISVIASQSVELRALAHDHGAAFAIITLLHPTTNPTLPPLNTLRLCLAALRKLAWHGESDWSNVREATSWPEGTALTLMNILIMMDDMQVLQSTLWTVSHLVQDPVMLEQFCEIRTKGAGCHLAVQLLVKHFSRKETDLQALAVLYQMLDHEDNNEIIELVLDGDFLEVAEMRCVRPACLDDDGSADVPSSDHCVTLAMATYCAIILNRISAGTEEQSAVLHASSTLKLQLGLWYYKDDAPDLQGAAAGTLTNLGYSKPPDKENAVTQLQLVYETNAKLISTFMQADQMLSSKNAPYLARQTTFSSHGKTGTRNDDEADHDGRDSRLNLDSDIETSASRSDGIASVGAERSESVVVDQVRERCPFAHLWVSRDSATLNNVPALKKVSRCRYSLRKLLKLLKGADHAGTTTPITFARQKTLLMLVLLFTGELEDQPILELMLLEDKSPASLQPQLDMWFYAMVRTISHRARPRPL